MTRRLRLLAAGALLLGAGCGDDPVGQAGAVEGTWQLADAAAQEVYLRISSGQIEVFTEDIIADCFDRVLYEVLEVDGRDFRITSGPDTFTVQLHRDEDELRVTAFDQEHVYVESSIDPSTLLLCEPTNPGADCATLPPLTIAQTIEATLTGSDEQNDDGSHYDLYRVSLDAPANLVVEMTSSALDSYLVLYDSAGAFLEFNDDASNLTLNARLTPSLDAGCYIVMATSAFPDEFGDYELSLSLP